MRWITVLLVVLLFVVSGVSSRFALEQQSSRATVGDKGQIVIPARAWKIFHIQPGDRLLILRGESQGLAITKEQDIFETLIKPFQEK